MFHTLIDRREQVRQVVAATTSVIQEAGKQIESLLD